MDALFGLPRKKLAGVSFRSPLCGDLVFLDQTGVDEFVMDYSRPQHLNTVMSIFNSSRMHNIYACVCIFMTDYFF